jgi:serine/threonine protein kinase
MIGETLDEKLQIQSLLGSGGAGSVYKAFHTGLGKDVAVKILHISGANTQTQLVRFKREGSLLEKLNHPNIVKFYSFGLSQEGQSYAVLEYLDGITLADRLKNGILSRDEIRGLFPQILAAVGAAHAAGIMHRDLKPSNIFLLNTPNAIPVVKVVDFGLAKLFDDQQSVTRAGSMLGTPLYMSPEQCAGQTATQASDIYSIGCILYECFVGKPPFEGDTQFAVMMSHMNDRPLNTGDVSSPLIQAVLKKCLHKDPLQRYGSCDDFLHDLDHALNSVGNQAIQIRSKTDQKAAFGGRRVAHISIAIAAACAVLTLPTLFDRLFMNKTDALLERADADIATGRYSAAAKNFSEAASLLQKQPRPEATTAINQAVERLLRVVQSDLFQADSTLRDPPKGPIELVDSSEKILQSYLNLPEQYWSSSVVPAATVTGGTLVGRKNIRLAVDDYIKGISYCAKKEVVGADYNSCLYRSFAAASAACSVAMQKQDAKLAEKVLKLDSVAGPEINRINADQGATMNMHFEFNAVQALKIGNRWAEQAPHYRSALKLSEETKDVKVSRSIRMELLVNSLACKREDEVAALLEKMDVNEYPDSPPVVRANLLDLQKKYLPARRASRK